MHEHEEARGGSWGKTWLERAGGHAQLAVGMGRADRLLNIPSIGDAAQVPACSSVAVYWDWTNDALAVGEISVVGELEWWTGCGRATAQFDVPARGAQLSLAGGADGLSLAVWAEGTSTETVEVSAQAGLGPIANPIPPRRTLLHTLPADILVMRRIPAFAARVQMLAVDPNAAGIGTLLLEFRRDPVAGFGASVLGRVPFASGVSYELPAGSRYFGFSAAAVPATAIRSIWELCL